MDDIAKSLDTRFKLGLSKEQSVKINTIFREFMREQHFPIAQPLKPSILRLKYLRKALNVLSADQRQKYKTKKIELTARRKTRQEEKNERHITFLQKQYEGIGLSRSQLSIINTIQQESNKQLLDMQEVQSKILIALKGSLDKEQLQALEKHFSENLKKDRQHKTESTQQKYKYLKLNHEQASQISMFNIMDRKNRRENGYKNYGPNAIEQEFKKILSDEQFIQYANHQKQEKEIILQASIKEDANKSEDFLELKNRIQFTIENILPTKCKILDQLVRTASQKDLLKIELLKTKYNEKIDKLITKFKADHTKLHGTDMPNHYKLRAIEYTLLDINPMPSILADLDLSINEFDSIKLNEEQETNIQGFKLKRRDYDIKILERKIRGNYVSLASFGQHQAIPQYYELYSIILLEVAPQLNLDKMKKRQMTYGISL